MNRRHLRKLMQILMLIYILLYSINNIFLIWSISQSPLQNIFHHLHKQFNLIPFINLWQSQSQRSCQKRILIHFLLANLILWRNIIECTSQIVPELFNCLNRYQLKIDTKALKTMRKKREIYKRLGLEKIWPQ